MSSKKKTFYNPDWEDSSLHPNIADWIMKDSDPHYFRCRYCPGSRLTLSNMGITALQSHMKIKKHIRNRDSTNSIKRGCFFGTKNTDTVTADTTADTAANVVSLVTDKAPTVKKQKLLRLDTAPKKVLEAWILWALDVVQSHHSMHSSGNKGPLFRKMFPDNDVAASFGNLSRSKISYIVNFGLAVYFKDCIMQELAPKNRLPPRFTSCFDESFNKVTYTKQMDIHVFYFDERSRRTTRYYIGSQFLGHATAIDTLNDFKVAHKGLDIIKNLVQLSMDGPNVNWKFQDELESHRLDENPEAPLLLVMGSCGLHVLHGAYQTAHKKTNWEVQKVLKALHGVFKKSPARRLVFY